MLPVLEIQLIITGQAIVHCVILRYVASDIKYIKFKGWNIFHVDNPSGGKLTSCELRAAKNKLQLVAI